ncbi:hypothetical protein OUZ56_029586 [Daphnia magna]|uniref:Integrase zinc-binding domain-containing protein n=1 Tax=Daphnia magna TaxID=35525 RepID=A0ABR0B789_9CRUS|nr:hypothetical protein OUZ56_029586 [Daphnia magna]
MSTVVKLSNSLGIPKGDHHSIFSVYDLLGEKQKKDYSWTWTLLYRDSNLGSFASPAIRLTVTPPLTCEAMGKYGAVWCGSGEQELCQALEELINQHQEIQAKMSCQQIEWHFSPPHRPHFGGMWKRIVESCKKCYENKCEKSSSHRSSPQSSNCRCSSPVKWPAVNASQYGS